MKECPFCNLDTVEQQEVIAKNEHCMFLQTPQQVLVGSGLIVPIKHRETVYHLTEEEWSATFSLLQEVKTILDETYHPLLLKPIHEFRNEEVFAFTLSI